MCARKRRATQQDASAGQRCARPPAAAVAARAKPLEPLSHALGRSRGLRLVELDRRQLRAGAQLQARYGMRTPDALQLAATATTRCRAFITNDRALPSLPGIRTVQLRELLPGSAPGRI